jgi:IS30 family transposase
MSPSCPIYIYHLLKLCDKAASTMTIASAKAFDRIPKLMRKTLPVDNGKEFS